MLSFYPSIKPFHTLMLKVDSLHTIYVEQCGNPQGLPILFVHGGPGSGCSESDRCFFDPELYHIILFDQRGAGRSLPYACLEHNTTQDLVADMEKIRLELGIDNWIIFGGSWGSTLSLAYAQAHPDKTCALIVRGIFLGTRPEINWLYYKPGADWFFPEFYENFLAPLADRDLNKTDIIEAYYQLLTSEDEIKRLNAAKAWSIWEAQTATLDPNNNKLELFSSPHFALSFARIECHYFTNNCFFTTNQLLHNMDKIAHLPGIIIQGRYDMICPPKHAWLLHKAWPESELFLIRDAGHASSEPGIIDGLIRATQRFAKKLA
ncbi:MAG: prolyl aminopeptidase [Gammaproteobacteria bacterium RIFCSPHIGHO2_12_FULL_35_23]|nr:MAG: prolyl aminopeptidase [Gammaproteobacteria bacterium RIFCSPHIGHO2_12_FULL_35_23]